MARFIDLTLTLSPEIDGVGFEQRFTVERDGWNARTWTLYSHIGTHMDAPHHFDAIPSPTPDTIDLIPLERCAGPAWIARLGPVGPKALIEVEHLGEVAGKVRRGDSLLLQSGWSRYFGQPKFRDELPRISPGLAEWCVQAGVNILGVEPPSVADVHNLNEVTAIHRTLLGGGVIIVEGLTGLDQIRADRVEFTALPLKLQGGDGSPVRAFAVER